MSNHNTAKRPPNIVVLISHDLGCHIGPYGQAAERTPVLNRFAQESLRLDRYFVSSPGCSQSRSSFVTGRYPHANGQFGLANWGWKLNEDEQLLPELLRTHGYHTTLFGIWHLHEWTLSAFDSVSDDVSTLDSSPEGYAEIASERAADWIEQKAPSNKPFYLHVGFWEVHRPFRDTGASEEDIDEELAQLAVPDYLPDNEATRREFVKLNRSIMAVDNGVARVLEALEDSGLDDNTLVLFTADHGLPFQRAKGTLYDPGIHVACLARWPGHIAPGTCSDALVSNVDITPTLLDAAGAQIPESIQGRSLLGLLRGSEQNGSVHNAIFSEKTYHEHYDPIRCLRTDRYKYIRNFAERPKLVLPSDVYNSPSRQANTDDESLWTHRAEEEFYDIISDPHEQENLIDDPTLAETIASCRAQLIDWMEQTGDALLDGPVLRPHESVQSNCTMPTV